MSITFYSRGSTFGFVVVVVVAVDALLNYCEFRHGCTSSSLLLISSWHGFTSGSCVSRKIESRQFIKICIDLRRVNIRVDLRRVALIRYARPAV
jgi:hypothetical protein